MTLSSKGPPLADFTESALPLSPIMLPPRQLKKIQISCRKWLTRFLLTLASASRAAHTGAVVAATRTMTPSDQVSGVRIGAKEDVNSDGDDEVCRIARCVCPVWASASGFVALNGGILAGCTPHDVRAVLLNYCLLQPPLPLPTETILSYSSTLPFVLCSRRLALSPKGQKSVLTAADEEAKTTELEAANGTVTTKNMSALYVPTMELRRCAAFIRASGSEADTDSTYTSDRGSSGRQIGGCSGTPNGDAISLPLCVGVVVLQLPPSAQLWKGGSTSTSTLTSASSSSANRGCGFLYLLPCNAALVQAMLQHVFQKPVVGIERVLRQTCIATSATRSSEEAKSTRSDNDMEAPYACSRPRTCVSKAVLGIPGLYLVHDFLTEDEEAAIWKELYTDRQQLQLEYLSRRRVAHFNRRFIYGSNQLTREGENVNARPSFYGWMRARLQNDDPTHSMQIVGDYPFQPGTFACDQLTVNYYDYSGMGTCGIATHVDAHNAFDDTIFIVSLGSYTVMDCARWDSPAEVEAPTGVFLPPRSLAVMSGESRYGWTHCIAEKRTDTVSELLPTLTRGDRVSLTWRRGRTQRHVKVECPFPALCDGEE